MKTTMKATFAALALAVSAVAANAQDTGNAPKDGNPDGPRPHGHRPPPPAIIGAIDANHDHVIDADEIANASAALKALDKNGDGKLTPDEFVGKRPDRPSKDGANADRPHHDRRDGPPGDNQAGPSDDQLPGPPPGDE